MCSAGDNAALPALGFPIRESTGQRPFSALPWLIAAVHALHRLLVPRHPPYALTILTVIRPFAIAEFPRRERRRIPSGPVIPVFSRRLSMAADVASVQFSRTAEKLIRGPAKDAVGATGGRVCAGAGGAGLSKLNSMPGAVVVAAPRLLRVGRRRDGSREAPVRFGRRARPDRSSAARSLALCVERSDDRTVAAIGAP